MKTSPGSITVDLMGVLVIVPTSTGTSSTCAAPINPEVVTETLLDG